MEKERMDRTTADKENRINQKKTSPKLRPHCGHHKLQLRLQAGKTTTDGA